MIALKQETGPRPTVAGQPNDLDHKRIERALDGRVRYRYVNPRILRVTNGYRITAPCCSRNIDPNGGIIDIALLQYDDEQRIWSLLRKNHDDDSWEHHATYGRLPDLLRDLAADEERQFWQ